MKTLLRNIAIIGLLVLGHDASPTHSGEKALDKDKVRIGVSLSLTDENREWGTRSLAGIRMRLNEWKNAGEKPEVELVVRDNTGRPGFARKNVVELVEKEKVGILIGPTRSDYLLPEREYLKQHQVVAISPSATDPRIGGENEWIFRLMFDNNFQAQAMARHAYNNLGYRRAAGILNTESSYSESVFKPFAECFTKLGGEIVSVQRYDWKYDEKNVYDFHSIMEAVAASKPDLVFVPLYAPEVVEIMNESLKVNLDASFFGTDTWDSDVLLEAGGNKLWDAHYIAGYTPELETKEMKHFLSQYEGTEEAYAEQGSVLGYDTMALILHALRGAKTTEDVRKNLQGLKNYPLATGPITYDPKRGAIRPAYIRHIIKDGAWFRSSYVETIWPEGMGGVETGEGCAE